MRLVKMVNTRRLALARFQLLELTFCSLDGQRRPEPVRLTRHTPVTSAYLGQIRAAGLDELDLPARRGGLHIEATHGLTLDFSWAGMSCPCAWSRG